MYTNERWVVRTATENDGASADLVALMNEAREFSVSGVNLLEALDKVFEIWPDVGWVYRYEVPENEDYPANTIIIGGGGLNPNQGTYAYGKGNGLKSITRTVANADELATRIFAYGSSRNMLPRWYNDQNIKDADSVDIQNLMIPVSEWGTTTVGGVDLPDAAKAYLDADSATMTRLGLRPKTYYFDGTGDLPEIYPTIREMTIAAVRATKSSSSDPYYPSTSVYTSGSARVDKVLSVGTVFDSGLAGENGKSSVSNDSTVVSQVGTMTMPAGESMKQFDFLTRTYTIGESGSMVLSVNADLGGTVVCDFARAMNLLIITSADMGTPTTYELEQDALGNWLIGSYNIPSLPFTGTSGQTVTVKIALVVYTTSGDSARTFTTNITGDFTSEVTRKRATTFKIGIRQIGFDINAQAALGDNKTIAFRSGKCAGRSFAIKTCTYVQATDSWSLEVIRSQDDSLSQWFPNTDYPVRGVETNYGGDEFVLLDIAMPDEYVLAAEMKLLNAAQELLDDASVERWQYNPEIDAKFMVENDREILPGESMTLMDGQIVDGSSDNAIHLLQHGGGYVLTSQEQRILLSSSGYITSALVDTVVISEGEAAIPTYKVTLLDRKRKSFSEAKGADSISSTPVTKLSSTTTNTATATKGDTYFTLDENGNVTLKEQYQNLWVSGWMAAGGVGTGGGGGGGASYLNDLNDVNAPSPSNGQALVYRSGEWVNETIQVSGNYIPLSGSTAITGTLGASGWSITTGGAASLSSITRSGAILYIGNTNNQGYVWLREDTYIGGVMLMGGTSTSSANALWSITSAGAATFASVAVNGGTSSGFLKADGSVDTTTYLTSHQSVTLATGTNSGTMKLTTAAGTTDNIAVKNCVTTDGTQTISGTKTFSATTTAANIIPGGTNDLGSSSSRWSNIYGSNANLTGNLSMAQASTITIGPITISYDSVNKALHISGTDNGTTIGLYCDGFVSAGGVQSNS